LRGHHRSQDGARPRHQLTHDESGCCDDNHAPQARLFLCAVPVCRIPVVICSDCDRGHVYCAECARHARRRSLRQAGRRYQASSRGRINHAERSRRYRARHYRAHQNKVTHHSSLPDRTNALLVADPAVVDEEPLPMHSQQPPRRQQRFCLRCGRRCSEQVRQGFLQRRVRQNRRRGPEHDYFL
jgi:hypothetical protein